MYPLTYMPGILSTSADVFFPIHFPFLLSTFSGSRGTGPSPQASESLRAFLFHFPEKDRFILTG